MMGIYGVTGAIMAVWVTCGVFLSTAVNAVAPLGRLEIRITDHEPAIEKFRRLDVRLTQVSLHKKGRTRRQGWYDVLDTTPTVDIVPLKNGVYRSLGERPIAYGQYDAVRVRFAEASGTLKGGGEAPGVVAHDGVVALDVDVSRQGNTPILIDLYAEDQTEHRPARYVVKIKEIRNVHTATANTDERRQVDPWATMRKARK